MKNNQRFLNGGRVPLVLVFSIIPVSFAIEAIYEDCNWKSKSWTEKLVKTINDKNRSASEAEAVCHRCTKTSPHDLELTALQATADDLNAVPMECFLAGAIKKYKQKGSRKRFYYCESPDSLNIQNNMPVRDTTGQDRRIYPRSPCLNKDYMNMIRDSFHYMAECFGFETDLPYLFSLFNHESSFILNKQSNTGARCVGQLTKDTVKTINKYIYMSQDPELQHYHNIYKQALLKCPDLETRLSFLPKELLRSRNPTFLKLRRIHNNISITCLTTQDPDICFFYSLYNISVNRKRLTFKLESLHENLPENLEIPKAMKETFKMPVLLNEMVRVKGTVTTDAGAEKEIDILLENDYEIHQEMSRYKYNPEELQVTKQPVYDFNKAAEWAMLYLAYNGGMSVMDTYFKEFLIKKKRRLASGKTCKGENRSTPICRNQKRLQQGQSMEPDFSLSETAQSVVDKLQEIRILKWEIKKLKKKNPDEAPSLIAEKEKQITELTDGMETEIQTLRQSTLGQDQVPELFSDYLLLEYAEKVSRRAEVITFLGKIKADAKGLRHIRGPLNRVHKRSERKPDDTEAESFYESVKNKCQFPLE